MYVEMVVSSPKFQKSHSGATQGWWIAMCVCPYRLMHLLWGQIVNCHPAVLARSTICTSRQSRPSCKMGTYVPSETRSFKKALICGNPACFHWNGAWQVMSTPKLGLTKNKIVTLSSVLLNIPSRSAYHRHGNTTICFQQHESWINKTASEMEIEQR